MTWKTTFGAILPTVKFVRMTAYSTSGLDVTPASLVLQVSRLVRGERLFEAFPIAAGETLNGVTATAPGLFDFVSGSVFYPVASAYTPGTTQVGDAPTGILYANY
jgi:hypothetical protein